MMEKAELAADWYLRLQELITSIRGWKSWSSNPLAIMREESATPRVGSIALSAYARYVRRFTLAICSILSKAPEADDRFWRLANNLHDELGGKDGLHLAHGKLIETANVKPETLSSQQWKSSTQEMDDLERSLLSELTATPWPLNLFALGPGTEAISDLFLNPLESWCRDALMTLPLVRLYFNLHRPEVEFEHQNEISKVLAEELSRLSYAEANAMFAEGKIIAGRVADLHLRATCLCYRLSLPATVLG